MLKLASIINQALTISLFFYISGKKTQQNKRTLAIAEVSNIRDEIFIMLKLAITMKEYIKKTLETNIYYLHKNLPFA